ncbi:MAG TPA: hypothetical protein VF576_12355 [Rubricoccaceae bacterium]
MRPSPAPRPAARRALTCAAVLAVVLAGARPAQAQLAEGGARVLGLGRAGVALGAEAWGHLNPAAWAGLTEGRGALQASQAFGLSELRLAQLTAAVPTGVGTVALAARTYGFTEHRETRVAVGFGRAIPLSATRRLEAGVSVGYETATTEGYGAVGTALLSVGVQGDVVRGIRAGLAGRNLLGILWDGDEDARHSLATVPSVAVGVAYAPSPVATLVLDAEQDLDAGLSLRAGLEVFPVSVLALRVGVSDGPSRISAGVGVRAGALRADLAVERHESLGLTPAVGVEVSF